MPLEHKLKHKTSITKRRKTSEDHNHQGVLPHELPYSDNSKDFNSYQNTSAPNSKVDVLSRTDQERLTSHVAPKSVTQGTISTEYLHCGPSRPPEPSYMPKPIGSETSCLDSSLADGPILSSDIISELPFDTDAFRLMDLPVEIRLMVWELLIPPFDPHWLFEVESFWGPIENDKYELLDLLLVSRTVRAELIATISSKGLASILVEPYGVYLGLGNCCHNLRLRDDLLKPVGWSFRNVHLSIRLWADSQGFWWYDPLFHPLYLKRKLKLFQKIVNKLGDQQLLRLTIRVIVNKQLELPSETVLDASRAILNELKSLRTVVHEGYKKPEFIVEPIEETNWYDFGTETNSYRLSADQQQVMEDLSSSVVQGLLKNCIELPGDEAAG